MNDFNGRKVFLTGASRGIGKSIKDTFEELGATVIAPTHAEMDLTNNGSIDAYFNDNAEVLKNIDTYVHCAGRNILSGIDEITEDVFEEVFQVNFFSAARISQKLVTGMKDKQFGRIVFISSLYGAVSRERRIAYSSSKHALSGLMKTMTLELAPFGIMVNSVAPGYVMTEMTKKNLSDDEIESIKQNIPTGRFQDTKEIADAVAFLCSENNKSITGQFLAVDGGFLCR
ncbi:SDR family NAD(P)-dependent oxidoreductase [Butyrivibrio sp. MB2005]|uniref:SDR family NAD(P)-dependent oxidoreductase n=1 Tax=Butyrivibrio sp. MB2005 TaxID=1280678 RepID=UPI00040D493A|nr:SDR family oxidoreductase [Butyrivibrio sp. MB2005]